jgi:hypothetical protein
MRKLEAGWKKIESGYKQNLHNFINTPHSPEETAITLRDGHLTGDALNRMAAQYNAIMKLYVKIKIKLQNVKDTAALNAAQIAKSVKSHKGAIPEDLVEKLADKDYTIVLD